MQLNYIYNKEFVSKEVNPQFDEYADICVVGLGTAGAFAAINAAKDGAKVIGIEKLQSMGGAGTYGGVYDYFYGSDGGIFEEVNEKCFEIVKRGYLSTDRYENKSSLPGHIKARVLEEYATNNGCSLYYNTSVTGVFLENNRVVGIQIFKDKKIINISSKVVIDSTGEAFICRLAGCKLMPGRLSDNQLMIFSKPIGIIYNDYLMSVWHNYDFIDITDAKKYSQKVLESLARPCALIDWYDNDNRTIYESTHIGMRECYCVETEETYTIHDVISNKEHKESLFYAFAPLDNTNHDIAFENTSNQDWFMLCAMPGFGFSVGVTKNMLIPKGYDGLMIASKGIGIGHDLCGLVRMKKDMEKCGETAGTIASLAVGKNISIKDVLYEDIIEKTLKTKCYDEANNLGICYIEKEMRNADGSFKKAEFPETIEDIKKKLYQEDFGTAMWKIRTMESSIICPKLKEWILEEDEQLRINCAFALGMLGDNYGAEIIRGIIKNGATMPKTKVNQRFYINFSKALLLAGRLKDTEVIDDLLKIVECDGVGYADNLETCSYYKTISDFENNFVSISIGSLIQISDVSPRGKEIIDRIKLWLESPKQSIELEKTRRRVLRVMDWKYA